MPLPTRVCRIAGMAVNQYLILEPGDLTLVDTGMPGNHKKIFAVMARQGLRPQDLRRILITHADPDHYGALNEVRQAGGARVCASAAEAEAIRRGASSRQIHPTGLARLFLGVMGRFFRLAPAAVDEILVPGTHLPLLGGLEVLDTAGHTPGHLSFYSPSTGVLFAGDSITVRGRGLASALRSTTWDEAGARRSFDAQVALRPRYVCAGHGYWESPA